MGGVAASEDGGEMVVPVELPPVAVLPPERDPPTVVVPPTDDEPAELPLLVPAVAEEDVLPVLEVPPLPAPPLLDVVRPAEAVELSLVEEPPSLLDPPLPAPPAGELLLPPLAVELLVALDAPPLELPPEVRVEPPSDEPPAAELLVLVVPAALPSPPPLLQATRGTARMAVRSDARRWEFANRGWALFIVPPSTFAFRRHLLSNLREAE
jgi:hypothetical protein